MKVAYDEAPMPHQPKDEDLWFKFFTKTQLKILIPLIIICSLIFYFFYKIGLATIGLVIGLIVLLLIGSLVMIPIPENQYLLGTGKPFLYPILFMIIKRKKKYKKIYTREGNDN